MSFIKPSSQPRASQSGASQSRDDQHAARHGGGKAIGKVAAFVRDSELRAVAARCLETALPAPATLADGTQQSGIDFAIEQINRDPSPRLLLVDLTGVSDPLAALDRLAEVCHTGTRVVALGDINDVRLYQQLRAAGVAEYLVKPVSEDHLRAALQPEPVADATQAAGARPVVVVGTRGGVGATTVAVSLAWLSAQHERKPTVLVDLDLASGTAGLALDVETGRGFAEAMATPDRIDGLLIASATVKVGGQLYLLAAELPLDSPRHFADDAVPLLVAGLRQSFRSMVFDVPVSEPNLLRQAFQQAASIVIVTDFTLAGARDAMRLWGLAERLAPDARRLLVGNRLGAAKKGCLTQPEYEKAIGASFTAVIAEDGHIIPAALASGKTVPEAAPGSAAAAALYSLAEAAGCLLPSSTRKRGWLATLFDAAGNKPDRGKPDGGKPGAGKGKSR